MAGNIIVTTTVNKVTWQVDKTAYGRALKQVKSLKREWEKVGSGIARKNNPGEKILSAAQQAKLVTKRLAQTERAEAAKTTAHAIAMAKKEAAARKAIDKVENARRKQAVGRILDSRTAEGKAEYKNLRDHYRKLQKEGGPAANTTRRPLQVNSPVGYSPSGNSHFGSDSTSYDQGRVNRQVEAMNRGAREQAKQQAKPNPEIEKRRAKQRAALEKETADYRRALARREVVIGNAQRRLESQLGSSWRKRVKGFDTLSDSLKLNAGDISQYNSQIGQMIRNAKAAAGQTVSLSDSIKSLRRSLIGVTAAYSAFNGAASILSAGQFFESTKATMLMVSDTTEEAGKKMQFVQDQSYRLGLDLKVASQGFTQMAVSAKGVISDSDTNKLFTGLSEFATASGADAVKYQRAITAVGQMLGKGQIMSEELKGQLSEALPGAMQAFVRAAQKYFKDDKIGVPELQDLMKDGKLLAKDILPLVADEFATAARKNGALNAQLKSNRVAMERMRQSWMKFQDQIFQGGFGEEMTKLFNMLADIMNINGPAGKAIGEFAKGFIESMRLIIAHAYDAFILITAIIQKFLDKLGVQKDEMGKIWNWAGMIVGALLFGNALARILSIIKAIAGFKATMKLLGGVFGSGQGGGTPDIPGGDPGKKTPKGGGFFVNFLKFAKIAAIGSTAGMAGDLAYQQYFERNTDKLSDAGLDGNAINPLTNMPYSSTNLNPGLLDVWDELKGFGRKVTVNPASMSPAQSRPASGASPYAAPQSVEGEIKVIIDAGKMQDLIDERIETANMGNINMILGIPSN